MRASSMSVRGPQLLLLLAASVALVTTVEWVFFANAKQGGGQKVPKIWRLGEPTAIHAAEATQELKREEEEEEGREEEGEEARAMRIADELKREEDEQEEQEEEGEEARAMRIADEWFALQPPEEVPGDCPISTFSSGIGMHGFEHYPVLVSAITVDANQTVVVSLHNLDFNDTYREANLNAWSRVLQREGVEPAAKFLDEAGSCPHYSGLSMVTRETFVGQGTFRCLFPCQGETHGNGEGCGWAAPVLETQPMDKAPNDVTCATSLQVWCPLPPEVRRRLLRNQPQSVQLARSVAVVHQDGERSSSNSQIVYPRMTVCPQPSPPPPLAKTAPRSQRQSQAGDNADKTDKDKGSKGGLAVCAMFDPHYNRAQDFARWARWHYALGVEHIFVYYMDPGQQEQPDFMKGPYAQPGQWEHMDPPDAVLPVAVAGGRASINLWQRWPAWWWDKRVAVRTGEDGRMPRDWRVDIRYRVAWPEFMQVPAYNDCRLRALGAYTWVAPMDVDEYIHPVGPLVTLPSYLSRFDPLRTTGVRLCQRRWWTSGKRYSHTTNFPDIRGDHKSTTRMVHVDNGSLRKGGCTCKRWWKTILSVDALAYRMAGNNMHDAERDSYSLTPGRDLAHINLDACTEMAISHLRGELKMLDADTRFQEDLQFLGNVTHNAFMAVDSCLDKQGLEKASQCVHDRWEAFGPVADAGTSK